MLDLCVKQSLLFHPLLTLMLQRCQPMLLEKVAVAEFHRGSRHVLVSENHHPELNRQVFNFLPADVDVRAGLSANRGRIPRGIAPDKINTILERICVFIDAPPPGGLGDTDQSNDL